MLKAESYNIPWNEENSDAALGLKRMESERVHKEARVYIGRVSSSVF